MINNDILKREDSYHEFYKKVIKAIRKGDSSDYGIALQNSKKYRSYKIKRKRMYK